MNSNNTRISKKDRREQAREKARIFREEQKRKEARTRLLFWGGGILAVAAMIAITAVVVISNLGERKEVAYTSPLNMATNGVIFANGGEVIRTGSFTLPTEEDPDHQPQAYTDFIPPSSESLKPHLELYLDFGCIHCSEFENNYNSYIEQKLWDDEITVEVKPVNYLNTPLSSNGALGFVCVANYAPEYSWDYIPALYELQATNKGTKREVVRAAEKIMSNHPAVSDVVGCINGEEFAPFVSYATGYATVTVDFQGQPLVPGTPGAVIDGINAVSNGYDFIEFVQLNIAYLNGAFDENTEAAEGGD